MAKFLDFVGVLRVLTTILVQGGLILNCSVSLRVLIAMALTIASYSADPVLAKIRCQGPNQIIKPYGAKPTPYCQDEYLARVARSRGMSVSGSAIRQNINLKVRVCRMVGHDIRVSNICSGLISGGRRDRH